MNFILLMGRLTKDPEFKRTGDTMIGRYTIAVDRRKKGETDFINCVTFGKNAEFAKNYLHKGTKIAVRGRIQTGSYEKDGRKVYTTDVVVEEHEFCESKGESKSDAKPQETKKTDSYDGFMSIPDTIDEELPFN